MRLFIGIMKEFTKLLTAVLALTFISLLPLSAQGEKKYIRQGNKEYNKEKFQDSEVLYRKAMDKNKSSANAAFNTGDALYKQGKYEDAISQFNENQKMYEDKDKKSASLYNLGNSLLKANKVRESIEAYKSSLRLKPDQPEAKYNLAYAQDLLKKQEEQQKQEQGQGQNQDQNDKGKNQDNKDEQDRQQDNDNQNTDRNDNRDQQNQQDQENNQEQQSLSREDAERILNAIANDEKNVQEQLRQEKAAKIKVKTLKNW